MAVLLLFGVATFAGEPLPSEGSSARLSISPTTGEFDWLVGEPAAALRFQGKIVGNELDGRILDERGVVATIMGSTTLKAMTLRASFIGLGNAKYSFLEDTEPTVTSEDITPVECELLARMRWIEQAGYLLRNIFDRMPPEGTAESTRVGVVVAAFDFVCDPLKYLSQCKQTSPAGGA